MEAKDRMIKEFVTGKDVTFIIPSYQRKYKWEFKKEVLTLIEDLQEFINDDSRSDYFLGSVIVKAEPSITKNYLLVDGQQRITTFLLLVSAMRQTIKEEGPFKYNIESILQTEEDKFKLNRINDFNTIKKILLGQDEQLTQEDKETQYYKVYSKLREFLNKKEKEESGWIETFYDKGLSNVVLAVIGLATNEDEFLVFESINSKGQNLSSGDLIKNYVMMQFTKDEKLEQKFENEIVEKLNEKTLADFYRQVVALETGKLASKNGKALYYEFRKLYPREKVNSELVNELKHKLAIWNYIHETDFGLTSYPLMRSGLLNYYGIVHSLVKDNSTWENESLEINNDVNIKEGIKKLSLVHIMRTLGGRGRVESNRTFASIGSQYYKSSEGFDKMVIEKLQNETGKTRTPSWNEVEDILNTNDVYSNQNIILSILISIEEFISKKKIDDEKLSIEHIYPQNPNEEWDLDENESNEMKILLNTLGNISMTNDNSALGNKIFSRKKEILEERSYLKINKMIYDVEDWNPSEVKDRAKKIIEYIKQIWE